MARASTVTTAFRSRPASAALSATRRPTRMQPRLEQRLIGVDVADAGHDALVEQHRLEAAVGPAQLLAPFRGVDVGRLRSQAKCVKELPQRVGVAKQRHAAETTHIAETQLLAAILQVEQKVRMIRRRLRAGRDGELSGHAQVEDEG